MTKSIETRDSTETRDGDNQAVSEQQALIPSRDIGLVPHRSRLVDGFNKQAQYAIPLLEETRTNIQDTYRIAMSAADRAAQKIIFGSFRYLDENSVESVINYVREAQRAGIATHPDRHRQLRDAEKSVVKDMKTAALDLNEQGDPKKALEIQKGAVRGLTNQAWCTAFDVSSWEKSGEKPSIVNQINQQNKETLEYVYQTAINISTLPIDEINLDDPHIQRASRVARTTPLYLSKTDPSFSISLENILHEEVMKGNEKSIAIEAFRDVYAASARRLMKRLVVSDFPDQNEQNSKEFEQLFQEYVNFWFNNDTTQERTIEQADKATEFMQSIVRERFARNHKAGAKLIEYWRSNVVSEKLQDDEIEEGDYDSAVRDRNNKSGNQIDINRKLRMGYAGTLMELARVTSEKEFMEEDLEYGEEITEKFFENLIEYSHDPQTRGKEYIDQNTEIGNTLDSMVMTILKHHPTQSLELLEIYQEKVREKLDRGKKFNLSDRYSQTGAKVLNKLTLKEEHLPENAEQYKKVFDDLRDVFVHLNFDGNPELNNEVSEAFYTAVNSNLKSNSTSVSLSLIESMRDGLNVHYDLEEVVDGNFQVKDLNERVVKIKDPYGKGIARAIQWTYTDPSATPENQQRVQEIVDGAIGYDGWPPLIATIIENFGRIPTAVRLSDLPKEARDMLEEACGKEISVFKTDRDNAVWPKHLKRMNFMLRKTIMAYNSLLDARSLDDPDGILEQKTQNEIEFLATLDPENESPTEQPKPNGRFHLSSLAKRILGEKQ